MFFVPLVVLVGDALPVMNTGTRVEGAGFDTDLSPLNSIDMPAVQGVPHPITLLAQLLLKFGVERELVYLAWQGSWL